MRLACIVILMKFITLPMIAGVCAVVISACAPSSPAGRIDRNREAFDALTAKHREEVRDGRISRGMPYEAVLLAWGRPSRQVEMVRPNGPVVRWDYSGTRPIYNSHFYGGYGRSRYGRYGGAAFGFGPEVVYVPTHRASVWFVNGKVDAWESVR